MKTIPGLSGCLRRASFNAGLLRAAADQAADGVRIEIGIIRDVPLPDGDLEAADGLPPAIAACGGGRAAAGHAGIQQRVPGVFKNAIDWMSRGDGLAMFAGKPVALIGASPGGFGTILSQAHWLPGLRMLKARPWQEGRLMVSRAAGLFDDHDNLTDEKTREVLRDLVVGFTASLWFRGPV